MGLEGRGRVVRQSPLRIVIYLEPALALDSQFPFAPGEDVALRVDPAAAALHVTRWAPQGRRKKKEKGEEKASAGVRVNQ